MRTSLALLCLCFGCATASTTSAGSAASAPSTAESVPGAGRAASTVSAATGPAGMATLEGRSGSKMTGSARFVAVPDGLGVHVEVAGATPGAHGVAIHSKGDCEDPKALSAGAHYDPNRDGHHGGPATAVRHGGDLGNIQVGQDGKGVLDVVVAGLSVGSVQDGVVGKALVVTEGEDDLKSDPAGSSGARVACGKIMAPTEER